MDVVQEDGDRRDGRGLSQQRRNRVEHPEARAFGLCARFADELRKSFDLRVWKQGAQRLQPRPECRRPAGLPRAANRDAGAGSGGLTRERLSESALPDTGLPGDQDDRAPPTEGPVEQRRERREIALAANQTIQVGRFAWRPRPIEAGVVVENALLERGELAARLEAEVVHQRLAG